MNIGEMEYHDDNEQVEVVAMQIGQGSRSVLWTLLDVRWDSLREAISEG